MTKTVKEKKICYTKPLIQSPFTGKKVVYQQQNLLKVFKQGHTENVSEGNYNN